MIGAASPDFKIGSQGLKKLNIVGDVQTGKYVWAPMGVRYQRVLCGQRVAARRLRIPLGR